jgi:hypothetical protein
LVHAFPTFPWLIRYIDLGFGGFWLFPLIGQVPNHRVAAAVPGAVVVRRLLASIVVLAFALRSVVPVGFMLAPAATGELTVVICTGHGPAIVTLTADGKLVPAKPKPGDHALCAYASVGGVALSEPVAAPSALGLEFADLAFTPTRDLIRVLPRAGATSARGPPSLS